MYRTKLLSNLILAVVCSFLSACHLGGEISASSMSAGSSEKASTASSSVHSEPSGTNSSDVSASSTSEYPVSSGGDASSSSSDSEPSSAGDVSSSDGTSSSSSSPETSSSQGQTSSEPPTSSEGSSSEEPASQSSIETDDHSGGGSPVQWFLVGSGSLWANPWSDAIGLFSNPNNPADLAMYLDVSFCTGDLFKIRNDSNEWLGYERYANASLLSFQQSGPSDLNIVCVEGGRFDIYLNSSKSIWIAAHAG